MSISDENMRGVIKEVNDSTTTATVALDDKSIMIAKLSQLKPLPPQEHDMVLVIGGSDAGVEGELVCIDANDAIVKDDNEDFKIVHYGHLVKIQRET